MADGSLKFDTKIDTEGFEKGTSSLKDRLKGVVSSLNKSGTEISRTFGGASSSVMRVENSLRSTEEAMKKLKAEMDSFANKRIPTEEYNEIKKQLDDTTAKYNTLQEKQERFIATGGKTDSKTYKNMQYDLEQLKNTIDVVQGELDDLVDRGKAFTLGRDTTKYADMQAKYKDLASKADVYRQRLKEVDNQQRKASVSTKKLSNNMKKTARASIPLTKSILKLSNMFKLMVLRMMIRAVINAVKEGFQNLAQYSNQANKDMSALATSAQTLKNSFAAAFAPILTAITPALQTLINHLSQALTVMGQFFAVLFTGATTFTKAKDAQVDYAKSVAKTAKEANKALSPIDKLNVVSDSDSSGYEGPSPSQMFEEIEIDNKIIKFADGVKNAFEGIWETMKGFYNDPSTNDVFKGIKEGLKSINFDSIKDGFKRSVTGWGEITSTALKSLEPIVTAQGKLLGTHLKYGLAISGNIFDIVLSGFANFTDNMKEPIQNWITETTTSISNGIGSLANIYEHIGSAWMSSIETYRPLVIAGLESLFTNVTDTIMLVGTIVADVFDIVTGKILEFVEENEGEIQNFTNNMADMFVSGLGLVNDIWKDTLEILKNFWEDWGKGIVDSVMDIAKDIGKWFLYLWNDLVKPVWDRSLKWLKDIWNDVFKGLIDKLLVFIGKLLEFVKVAWDKVIQPIANMLLKTLVPAFKWAFDVVLDVAHTLFKGIGDIVKGIIKSLGGILDFLTGMFTGDWKKAWEGIKNIFKGIWDALVGIVKVPINLIIDIINGLVQGIVTAINIVISGINSISFKIPDWVPGIGGKGVGFNIPAMSIKKIPKLATGTVVPANYGEFLTVMGDSRYPEIVSPVPEIERAVENVLNRRGNTGGGEIHIWLEGDAKGIFKLLRVAEGEHYAQTGRAVFVHS